MSGWTVAWLFWLAMFLVIEGSAVMNKKPGDTLSEHIWKWFSVREKSWGWRWRRIVLLATITWLVVHLVTGWV